METKSFNPNWAFIRFCGGMVFQPIYTFQDRCRALADYIKSDLLDLAKNYTHWSAKGFIVSIEEDSRIVIRHLQHKTWHLFVRDSELYFQYDMPEKSDLDETAKLQSELLELFRRRMGIDNLSSWGVKFIPVLTVPSKIDKRQASKIIGTPYNTAYYDDFKNKKNPLVVDLNYPFYVGYASLKVFIEQDILFVIDLDCYCVDPLSIKGDYLTFCNQALEHLVKDIGLFLKPLSDI